MAGNQMRKNTAFAAAAVALAIGATGMFGCSVQQDGGQQGGDNGTTQSADGDVSTASYDFSYTDRDLDPSYDKSEAVSIELSGSSFTSDSDAVSASDTGLSIIEPGVYKLSGSYEGTVSVSIPDDKKVQLVLAGADIVGAENNPAIKIESADKAFITLEDGTSNSVRDRGSVSDETEDNAAIWASCDLTVQGSGSLEVTGDRGDGLKSKDDLAMTGGNVSVSAKSDAVVGHDSVKMTAVSLSATAKEGDAVKCSESDKEDKGFVSIDDGDISLTSSADDGIDAAHYIRIAGGKVSVEASDDGLHSDLDAIIEGGDISIDAGDDGIHSEYSLTVEDGTVDVSRSYEGYEAQNIAIKGGTNLITAEDDGINAAPAGGTSEESKDSAAAPFAAEHQQTDSDEMAGGQAPEMGDGQEPPEMADDQEQPEMPDGQAPQDGQTPPDEQRLQDGQAVEGQQRQHPDGKMKGYGPRRGQNADGQSQDGQPFDDQQDQDMQQRRGGMGAGMMDISEDCSLVIEGGTVYVNAKGDGLDSNGSISIEGGTVLVNGPENNGNAAVDFGTGATINGGVLVAIGTSGMYEGFSKGSQAFVEASTQVSVGDAVALVKDGTVLASLTAARSGDHVVVSTPDVREGEEYEIIVGGAIAGTDIRGYSNGTHVTGGNSTTATAVAESSGSGKMGGFGNSGGMKHGFWGEQSGEAQGDGATDGGQDQGA